MFVEIWKQGVLKLIAGPVAQQSPYSIRIRGVEKV